MHVAGPSALASGFHYALIAAAVFLVAAAAIAVRATNTRGEHTLTAGPVVEPVLA